MGCKLANPEAQNASGFVAVISNSVKLTPEAQLLPCRSGEGV